MFFNKRHDAYWRIYNNINTILYISAVLSKNILGFLMVKTNNKRLR